MAYKALYRTYRPNNFDEVYGQEHIVKTLQNAVEQHKIAHAYLFCGPRGTGKTSVAKIFAKAVNCTAEKNHPCMKCDNCLAVTEGSHPDIVEIDAASNNGVEEVRSLIEKVKYAPIKGKYKVYIIDEVHMMSTGAFNALLKTIEEPPAHVIFILATTEPHKVIPTIISRCQRYDFTKISDTEIRKRLHLILENEHITCEEEVIRIVAQLSDGGMRDALSILDQCIAYAQDNIKVHHINEIYGITTVQEKIELLLHINKREAQPLIEKLKVLIEKGIDIKRLTMDMIDIIKETVIFDYTSDDILLHVLTKDEAKRVIDHTSTTQRLNMIEILMDTYDKYRNAANVSAYFEVCLLKMMNTHVEDVSKLVNQVSMTNITANTNNDGNVSAKNVSRETKKVEIVPLPPEPMFDDENQADFIADIPEKIENKKANPLNDEFVLQLLVGANKPEKQNDQESFQKINEYMMELEWAKFASLLKNGKIMASAESYILLSVSTQAEANEINEKDSGDEFASFTDVLLKKSKKVFAITNEQQGRILVNFRERMQEGTLPSPIEFKTKKVKKKIEVEKSEEELVIDLFGEENIVITED